MTVLIFANGDIPRTGWIKPYLKQAQLIIAADGGARHLLALGQRPNVVIGDLDSLPAAAFAELSRSGVEFVAYPRAKDETDLELALMYAAKRYSTDILVFGSLGGRLDQTLANIFLLVHPALQGLPVRLVEPNQSAWLVEEATEIDGAVGDTVSLIPLGDDALVKETSGLQWALKDERLPFGTTRGVSNVMTGRRATVRLKSGRMICVYSTSEWER